MRILDKLFFIHNIFTLAPDPPLLPPDALSRSEQTNHRRLVIFYGIIKKKKKFLLTIVTL